MRDYTESDELYAQPMPRSWVLPLLMPLLALGLYFWTLSPVPFPGAPAHALASQLLLNDSIPFLFPVWGVLLRFCPAADPVRAATLLSAVFGALSVFLFTALVQRVRFSVHDKDDPSEVRAEYRARRLAAAVSALYLTVCYPFWVHSTRTLPGSFHIFLLLAVVWIFSEYQRRGDTFLLLLFGLFYGIGCVEYTTFVIFAPLAAVLVFRAMYQRAAFRWVPFVGTFLCALPAAVIYLAQARFLWDSAAARAEAVGYGSATDILLAILRSQWHLVTGPAMAVGFLIVLTLVVIPWSVLFIVRTQRPAWRYSFWQVFLRLAIFAAALVVLAEIGISPCKVFGIHDPMLIPHLVLALCIGRVCGEFSIMGTFASRKSHGALLRRCLSPLPWIAPLLILASVWLNFPNADARTALPIHAAVRNAVAADPTRDILFSNGGVDDNIRLAARALGRKLTLVDVSAVRDSHYRDVLSTIFKTPRQQALLQVGFVPFVRDFLSDDANLARTATFDADHYIREFGYLVPDGLIYGAVPTEDRVSLEDMTAGAARLLDDVHAIESAAIPKDNPASPYAKHLLRIASKTFDNIGFSLMTRGRKDDARAMFENARAVYPENIAALLNLLTLASEGMTSPDAPKPPEVEALENQLDSLRARVNARSLWNLGPLYGYLYNPAVLVRSGMMWAASGSPKNAEAEFRRAGGGKIVNPAARAFLARAFLEAGNNAAAKRRYADIIRQDRNNFPAYLKLAEIAMAENRIEHATILLEKARSIRPNSSDLAFDAIALDFIRGETDSALAALREWTATHKSDARAWALLANLTADGSDSAAFEQAVKSLKSLRAQSPDIRIFLAEIYLAKKDWVAARDELEQILRLNPRLVHPLELLIDIDFKEHKRELAEDHVRRLLTLDPSNYTGNLMLASFQYERNQLSLAESSYRAALAARRTPVALNDLAFLLLRKGNLEEARVLLDEALSRAPSNPVVLATNADLLLRENRLDEAEAVLRDLLADNPDNLTLKFLSASLFHARGQEDAAWELAKSVRDAQADLSADDQSRLADLMADIRAAGGGKN